MSLGLSDQVAPTKYFQGTVTGGSATPTYTGATANGNGNAHVMPYTGAIQVEIQETHGSSASATVALQGSFDGSTWYAVGYYQVDGVTSLTRSVANISVTASMKHVYQVLDPYPQMQAVISSIANSASIIVRAYCIPA